MSAYSSCVELYADTDPRAALECMATSIENDNSIQSEEVAGIAYGLDVCFLILSTALMFFMQAGFAVLCAGCVRSKNVQNTLMKNFLDACGAAIGFWSIGYALAFGETSDPSETTFVGRHGFFMNGVDNYALWLFNFAFAATAATIVAGTLAERCQMISYLAYSAVLTGFVYPVIVHSVWSINGFLSPHIAEPLWGTGMIDFAGSGVVHVTGGATAFLAVFILGPRKGRFSDHSGALIAKPKKIQGHSVSLQVLGTFILWFGWYGFNAGSALQISSKANAALASRAAVSTTLGAASGTIVALVLSSFVAERRTGETLFDITDALNGCLSGLVSITAGCALIEPWAAVVIGGIAGAIYLTFSSFLVRIKIDDAVDAIPVHFANGMWGVIAVGLFAVPEHLQAAYGRSDHVGWFYSFSRGSSDATLLGANLVGLLFIFGWVLGMMAPFFLFLNYLGWFRSDALEEVVGLDISYHGGPAYINDDIYAEQMTHVYEVAKAKDTGEFEEEENAKGDDKEGIA